MTTKRVTIVPDDGLIFVDNAAINGIDLSPFIDSTIHAVQWYGDRGWGEVEFKENPDGSRRGNQRITDFTPFEILLQVHADETAARLADPEREKTVMAAFASPRRTNARPLTPAVTKAPTAPASVALPKAPSP